MRCLLFFARYVCHRLCGASIDSVMKSSIGKIGKMRTTCFVTIGRWKKIVWKALKTFLHKVTRADFPQLFRVSVSAIEMNIAKEERSFVEQIHTAVYLLNTQCKAYHPSQCTSFKESLYFFLWETWPCDFQHERRAPHRGWFTVMLGKGKMVRDIFTTPWKLTIKLDTGFVKIFNRN